MKGFRTILFNLALALALAIAAASGHVLAPACAVNVVDLLLLVGGIGGNVLLRFLTSTPVGRAAADVIEQAVKLHPDALHDIGDMVTDAIQDSLQMAFPTMSVSTAPPAGTDLVALASHISGAVATINAVHAQVAAGLVAANNQVSAALPSAGPQSDPAPQPDPVPQPAAAAGQPK